VRDQMRARGLRAVAGVVALVVAAYLPVGVAAAAGSGSKTTQAKWTVMVYMSGDNNLEKFIVKDLETELGKIGSDSQVQVVALADRGPGFDKSRGNWTTTKLFHVTQGMRANAASAVADWGERDMGNPKTLTRFVHWTKANYPADHYAMYFWGHGWGWHPGWVLKDDTSNDTLDADEVRAALPSLGYFDVVGYDGCNMASIEIMDLWHGYAGAITSSQEWVGWEGLQYNVILRRLDADPDMSADQLAVDSTKSTMSSKTWSAVDVGYRFDDLISAVDAWSKALLKDLPHHRKEIRTAFNHTRSYWEAKMDKDLYDLAKQINQHVSDPAVHATGRDVMAAVKSVVLWEHHATDKAHSHGITIYGPANEEQKANDLYYRSLGFAKETHWDEFINALDT
jgi:hypothetical protein